MNSSRRRLMALPIRERRTERKNMTIAKINDIELYYEVSGHGRPVILLAGFGSDHNFWKTTVPRISDEFSVITIDNRGTGKTEYNGKFTLNDISDDVVALMDYLSIKTADIIGWSMGSQIAQWIGINHSERVRSLTLISSYRNRPSRSRYILSSMANAVKAGAPGDILGIAINSFSLTEEFFEKTSENMIKVPVFSDIDGILDQLDAINVSDTGDFCRFITSPTLSIHGMMDIMVDVNEGDAVADYINGCKRIRLKNTGHSISSSLYVDGLKSFLKSV